MGVVSDAFPLLRKVDGVIAVTRIGLCTRDSAAHLREQLARLEAPVLGIVANAVKLTLSAGNPGAGGGDFVECPPLCFQILEYGMNCRYPQFHVEVAGHRRAVEAGRAAAGLDL
jgi:hypothetical protein